MADPESGTPKVEAALYEQCGVADWCGVSTVRFEKRPHDTNATLKISKPQSTSFVPGKGYVLEISVYNGAGFKWRTLTSAILIDYTPPTTGPIFIVNNQSRVSHNVAWINSLDRVEFALKLGCYSNWPQETGAVLGLPQLLLTNSLPATPLVGDWADLESVVDQRQVLLSIVERSGASTLLSVSSLVSLAAQCIPDPSVSDYAHYMVAVPMPAEGVIDTSPINIARQLCNDIVSPTYGLCEPYEALFVRWSIGQPLATDGWTSWNFDGTFQGFYLDMGNLTSGSSGQAPPSGASALCCNMPRLFWAESVFGATYSADQAKLNCKASYSVGEQASNITLINKRLCLLPELQDLLTRHGFDPSVALLPKFWIDRTENVGYLTLRPSSATAVWGSRVASPGESSIVPYCCADRSAPASGLTKIILDGLALTPKVSDATVSYTTQGAGKSFF